ncbi:hypothetical protein [Fluviicola sp.]|uniref:hypothetical protein n=1 Tax=Fluviicola sp. TaxID=1917219 RepID=UPI0031D3FE5D
MKTLTIFYLNGNDSSIEAHYIEKEYRNDIIIEKDNLFYELHFFTHDSLEYEMTKDGFFSLPGLIILDEISNEKIKTSIRTLAKKGFFESFKGRKQMFFEERFSSFWYVKKAEISYSSLVEERIEL